MKLKKWVKVTMLIIAEILTLILAVVTTESGVTPFMRTFVLAIMLVTENLLFFIQD